MSWSIVVVFMGGRVYDNVKNNVKNGPASMEQWVAVGVMLGAKLLNKYRKHL